MALTRLLLLLFLLFASLPLHAEEQPAGPAEQGRPVKPEQLPINVTADRLEFFQSEQAYHADGSVVIKKGPWQLTADHVIYHIQTGKLTATGHVLITEPGHVIRGDRVDADINTKVGSIREGKMFLKNENYHIEGKLLERHAEDRYTLEEGSFTTCDIEGYFCPAWRIRARRLRVQLDHYLVARGAVLYIQEVPVMYFPYFIFPVKETRQTGFLLPHFGYNTQDGFKYRQSFFWAIATNQDLTATLDLRTERGVGGGLDYRYALGPKTGGHIEGNIFDDHLTHEDRLNALVKHSQDFTDELQLKIDGQFLSPVNTFQQLSVITEERSLRSIESNLILSQSWKNAYLFALTRYTKDLTGDNDRTIHRLPEIGYTLRDYGLADLPLFASLDVTANNFWCEGAVVPVGTPPLPRGGSCGVPPNSNEISGVKAFRIDAYPRLTARISLWDAAVLTPEAGYREIFYSRSLANSDSFQRGTYLFRVNLESPVMRSFSLPAEAGTKQLLHIVEPGALYEYVHGFNQGDIPQLDQVDAFPEKNLLTYSLTNRLVLKTAGEYGAVKRLEFFYLKFTQSYGRERIINLPPQKDFSDLRSEMTLRASRRVSLDVDSFLNMYGRHQFTTVDADVRYDWRKIFLLSLGERYTRAGTRPQKGDFLEPTSLGVQQPQAEDLKFITAGAAVNIVSRVSLGGKVFYDYSRGEVAEARAGVRYTGSCHCWSVTVAYAHFEGVGINTTGTVKNDISFFFSVTGLSNSESGTVKKLFEPLD